MGSSIKNPRTSAAAAIAISALIATSVIIAWFAGRKNGFEQCKYQSAATPFNVGIRPISPNDLSSPTTSDMTISKNSALEQEIVAILQEKKMPSSVKLVGAFSSGDKAEIAFNEEFAKIIKERNNEGIFNSIMVAAAKAGFIETNFIVIDKKGNHLSIEEALENIESAHQSDQLE